MYKDRLPSAGLFWAELAERGKELKALNTPKLGDSLLKADGTPWMGEAGSLRTQDQLGRPDTSGSPTVGQLAEGRSMG